MKGSQVVTAIAGVALVGVGAAMVLTNPSQSSYEDYATQRLAEYLQTDLCPQVPSFLGGSLEAQCRTLVDSNLLEIKRLVSRSTTRYNFGVFSVYRTNLSIGNFIPFLPSNIIPAYRFETIGLLDNFFTYQAQQQ